MKLKQLFGSVFSTPEVAQKVAPKVEVETVLIKYGIKKYTINNDLTVDVDGDVIFSPNADLKNIPVNFGTVSGSFECKYNHIVSLEGAPKEVGGHFFCSYNQLSSLSGSPRGVGGNFNCDNNRLTSLQGAPREVGGDFYCYNNQLTSLQGGPREVGGSFSCFKNQLITLKGSPREVGGNFYCDSNKLTSLDGIGNVRSNIRSDLS